MRASLLLTLLFFFCATSQIVGQWTVRWSLDFDINDDEKIFVEKVSPERDSIIAVLVAPAPISYSNLDRDASTYADEFFDMGEGSFEYVGEDEGIHYHIVMMRVPDREGIFNLVWNVNGQTVIGVLEITCSDDIFCNGAERYINGECVAETNLPCVYGDGECYVHQCLEDSKSCSRNPRRLLASGEWEDVLACPSCMEMGDPMVEYISNVTVCDNLAPVCLEEERTDDDQWCGVNCRWYDLGANLVDLIPPLEEEITDSIVFVTERFDTSDCAVEERCVGLSPLADPSVSYEIKLMKFDTDIHNIGGNFKAPDVDERPELFTYSPCHGHYHLEDFADFALNEIDGDALLLGHKQAFCLRDSYQWLRGPHVRCDAYYDCENQGISAGWSDFYGADLDCQWIDISPLMLSGEGHWFELDICINQKRKFQEYSLENNCRTFPVWIPADIDESVQRYKDIVGEEECALLPEGYDIPKICEDYIDVTETSISSTYISTTSSEMASEVESTYKQKHYNKKKHC